MPLHKGADGFLSNEQFIKFYWLSLNKVMIALIDEGYIPFAYPERSYNWRLGHVRELPQGKTIWAYDTTDMRKAKEILGETLALPAIFLPEY